VTDGSFAVGMAVVAVAAPAGQVLQRGPGDLPVAAAAGSIAAGLVAQQPARVGPVPLAVASMLRALVTAAALPLLARPAGPSDGE
jgi:hypothetical protein